MSPGSSEQAQRLNRPAVAALDAVLGVAFPVLDDGFVRVVDYMGHDGSVVQAARVSYGDGTKRVHEDRGLIRYLLRHAHTTPFEMCEIKLHVRVPMDTWRQWIRHRTANVNEYSTRYSRGHRRGPAHGARPVAARSRATTGKAAAGFLPAADGEALTAAEAELQNRATATYDATARRRRGPRAGAQGSAPVDLHRGVLEDRPAQPAALSASCEWTTTRRRRFARTPR